jgi:hypothetical protein
MSANQDYPILKRAADHLRQLGAQRNEYGSEIGADPGINQIRYTFNGRDFTIQNDSSGDASTTLSFSLDVLPDQAIDLDDPINTKINNLVDVLKKLVPPPAMIQRSYGYLSSESPRTMPDWPEREPVGTSIHISILLGWDDIKALDFSIWKNSEDTPFTDYIGLVSSKSDEIPDVETAIKNALQFIERANELLLP